MVVNIKHLWESTRRQTFPLPQEFPTSRCLCVKYSYEYITRPGEMPSYLATDIFGVNRHEKEGAMTEKRTYLFFFFLVLKTCSFVAFTKAQIDVFNASR